MGESLHFTWEPEHAELAADRTMGHPHGAWTLIDRGTDAVQSRGRYLTVWVRSSDGTWKVIADIGNTRP